MNVYHLEDNAAYATLCGIEFEPKYLVNLKVVLVDDHKWFCRGSNSSIDMANKHFCITCMLIYGRNPEKLFRLTRNRNENQEQDL